MRNPNAKKKKGDDHPKTVAYILLKSLALTAGALAVISAYKFTDAGKNERISLQCSISTITAADLSAAQRGDLSPTPVPASSSEETVPDAGANYSSAGRRVSYLELKPRVKSDSGALNRNTYHVTASDNALGVPEELVDVAEFTHDGKPYWIAVSLANLRSGPGIENDIVTSIQKDSRIIRISYGSEWSYIRTAEGQTGYILSSLLSDEEPEIVDEAEETQADEEQTENNDPVEVIPAATATPLPTDSPTPAPTAAPAPAIDETEHVATVYASCELNVRTGPGTDNPLVTVLATRDPIDVVALTSNGWYRTSGGNYVKAELTWDSLPEPTPVPAPVEETASTPEENTETNEETANAEPAEETAAEEPVSYSDFASYCLQFVGTPYQYGCASPAAFDCSGFVSYVMANYYGITLPHNAADIAALGTAVDAGSIQCGDVMCHDYNSDGYIDHVSLYLGNGTCIHASNSRQGVITSSYPMGSVVTIRRFI